uniref:Cytochrome P450 CYP2 n=1 Tax=Dermanyssus gallinae TaxID=34641 RepID=A0A6M3HBY3_9ACAR|nr:cytochrome P450 CYP2 [Dermanyssus gallinae]
MAWTVTLVLATILLLLPAAAYWARRRRQRFNSHFKRRGIAGPAANVWFGNALQLYVKGRSRALLEWSREFGDAFGYFDGWTPVIGVANADAAREIQTSKVNVFVPCQAGGGSGGRSDLWVEDRHDELSDEGDEAEQLKLGEDWTRHQSVVRRVLDNDTSRLVVHDAIGSVYEKMHAYLDRTIDSQCAVDLCRVTRAYSAEVFFKATLGKECGFSDDFDHPMVSEQERYSVEWCAPLRVVFDLFPSLYYLVHVTETVLSFVGILPFQLFGSAAQAEKQESNSITSAINEAIRLRRTSPNSERRDLLQLLFDTDNRALDTPQISASLTKAEGQNDPHSSESSSAEKTRNHAEAPSDSATLSPLNDDELVERTRMILEMVQATSDALISMYFCLMKHTDVQNKLRDELFAQLGDDRHEPLDQETISSLPYLDAVVKETLRLYPTELEISRKSLANVTLSNGLRIKAGDKVCVSVVAIHRDNAVFAKPDVFRPERFLAMDSNSSILQASCLAPGRYAETRIAELFLKLTISRLLLEYRLESAGPDTSDELEMAALRMTQSPGQPLLAYLERLPQEEPYRPPPVPTTTDVVT